MIIQAEISNERGRFKIMRDGIELTRSDGIRIKRNDKQANGDFAECFFVSFDLVRVKFFASK